MTHFDLITVGGGLAASTLPDPWRSAVRAFLSSSMKRNSKIASAASTFLPGCYRGRTTRDLRHPPRFVRTRAATCGSDLDTRLVATLLISFQHLVSHSEMQEALLEATASAGADVRRGVTVQESSRGRCPL